MAKVVLYHTQGCHLCEQAHELLLQHPDIEHIELRDIMDNAQWIEAYQVRIPVLCLAQKPQPDLGWPFDNQAVSEFIK